MSWSRIFILAVLTSLFVLAKNANLMIPMEDFEPGKIHGVWYGWARTAALFDKAAGCGLVHFLHKVGDSYRATFFYLTDDGEVLTQVMDIIDNTAEKARFVFENDVHTVALTILDTDYENYMLFYGLLGSKTQGVFYLAGRKPEMMEGIRDKFDAAVKKNEITFPFADVGQTNCPNRTGVIHILNVGVA